MSSLSKNARVAGLLYILGSAVGVVRLTYIPNALFVYGDATATANNIAAHESLFRLGIVSQLLGYALWLFVPLALYRLLKDVNRELAALMGWRCWSCLPPVLTAKMGHPQLIEMLPKGLLAGQTHHALYADFKVHHDYPASLALNSPKRDAIPQHADSLLSPLGYDGCHCCC